MQINSISSISAITPISTSNSVPARSGAAKPTVAASSVTPAAATAPSQAAVHPVTAVRSGGGSGGGGGSTASAAAAVATAYSTTVGGKSYAGSVSEVDGSYQASVPSVPGAVATGSSLQMAETNLDSVIDILA
jgi:hypothetical protein